MVSYLQDQGTMFTEEQVSGVAFGLQVMEWVPQTNKSFHTQGSNQQARLGTEPLSPTILSFVQEEIQ